jgi:hypothetical protein
VFWGTVNIEYGIFKTNTFETKILKNNKMPNIFKHQVKKQKFVGCAYFILKGKTFRNI